MKVAWMRSTSLLAGILLFALACPGEGLAEEPGRAALVIQFDQDRVETLCIEFDGDDLLGAELLLLAGLDAIVDTSSGIGASVCQIDGLGCVPPGEDCFCQCMGGDPCTYWNYYYRDPGQAEWVYSPFGAGIRRVKPGAAEGWVWGDGHTPPGQDLTYEGICVPPTPLPSPTARPLPSASPATRATTPEVVAVTAQPTASAPAQASATAGSPATEPPPIGTPVPLPGQPTGLAKYWPFGVLVLGLVGIAALVRLRRA